MSRGAEAQPSPSPTPTQAPEGELVAQFDALSERYAKRYASRDGPFSYFFRRRQGIVMRILDSSPRRGLLLDVGCGSGAYAAPCVDRGYNYLGVDLSPAMVATARKQAQSLKGANFAVADARHLPVATESVDVLLCLGVLEYSANDSEELAEITRVVRPGGITIFSFLNSRSPYWFCLDWLFPAVKFIIRNTRALIGLRGWASWRACLPEKVPVRKFTTKERTDALACRGFEVCQTRHFDFNVMPRPIDTFFPGFSVAISRRLEGLLVSPAFSWCAMAFVLVAKKTVTAAHASYELFALLQF